jgi:subtilase family serine protease
MRIAIFALTFVAALPAGAQAAGCSGADPALTSVKVANVTSDGSLKTYTLVGTVTNLGNQKQASNVLQFVDISLNGARLNDRGIPPLAPGQSYTFSYAWQRAVGAGDGTTTMHFHIRMVQPSPPGKQDCDTSNDTASLRF